MLNNCLQFVKFKREMDVSSIFVWCYIVKNGKNKLVKRCGSRVNFYSRTQFEIILKKNGQLAWVPDSTDVHPMKELSISLSLVYLFCMDGILSKYVAW